MGDISNTQFFKAVQEEKKLEVSQVLEQVYVALTEKGYNPINQMVGYIMSGDPTYITSHKSARSLIMKVERDESLCGDKTEIIKRQGTTPGGRFWAIQDFLQCGAGKCARRRLFRMDNNRIPEYTTA